MVYRPPCLSFLFQLKDLLWRPKRLNRYFLSFPIFTLMNVPKILSEFPTKVTYLKVLKPLISLDLLTIRTPPLPREYVFRFFCPIYVSGKTPTPSSFNPLKKVSRLFLFMSLPSEDKTFQNSIDYTLFEIPESLFILLTTRELSEHTEKVLFNYLN